MRAEGVALVSGMWGEEVDVSEPTRVKDRDAFALLWDEASGIWVAVYRMCVNIGASLSGAGFPATHVVLSVAFLRLPVGDPLLCLTASITVRERPMPMTPARAVLAAMLKEAEVLPEFSPPVRTQSSNDAYERDKIYHGIDEVNLLEGLSSGTAPSFLDFIRLIAYSTDLRELSSTFPPQHTNQC